MTILLFIDENKILIVKLGAILDFISAKFVMDYPCVGADILFYTHAPVISFFLNYVKITKLFKLKIFAPKS